MKLPVAYFDASVIEEVSTDLWRKVLDAVGWPASLAPQKTTFAHRDLIAAFERDEPTDELLQAFEVLHSLGTGTGRDAIVAAMADRRVEAQLLPTAVSDRELALELFLGQRNDAALVDVFSRAQAQVQEGTDQRRYSEFMGKEALPLSRLKARSESLRASTRRYCEDNDLGDHVHVRAFEDDGVYVFHVIRSHHVKKPLAVLPGHDSRATIEYRPVHGDVLRYDATTGRLRIAARAPSMIEFYRKIMGSTLFQDEVFFTGEAICSLAVLQERGRGALDGHNLPGVGRVRMTECLWERGDRNLLHLRSSDCFRSIEELKLPLTEGQLLQAKLKIEVVGRSTRPVTVNIRVPRQIDVPNKIHQELVDEYLDVVGIRNRKEPVKGSDIWSLYPWRHPSATWRAVFGSLTDVLVQREVLVPVQLEAVSSANEPDAGSVLEARVVSPGEFYGVSGEPEIPSQSLSSTDLDGLELKPEALRAHLRAEWSLTGTPATGNHDELLDLGELRIGDYVFRLTYSLRPPPQGTGDRMRARAGGNPAVLLLPTAVAHPIEIASVTLGDPIPSRTTITRQVIAACGLADAVPALFTAPEGARLVVDTRIGKVWIDGIEIAGLQLGTQPFRLVEQLARACPRPISSDELSARLSGARKDGNTAARQAKVEARKCISKAMSDSARAFETDPFPADPPGCYRCAVPAHVA